MPPTTYNAYSFSLKDGVLATEASDIAFSGSDQIGLRWADGVVTTYQLSHTEMDRDHDVQWWDYQAAPGITAMQVAVRIFND